MGLSVSLLKNISSNAMTLHTGCLKQNQIPFCRHSQIMPGNISQHLFQNMYWHPIHLHSVGFANTSEQTATKLLVVCIIFDKAIKKLINSWNIPTWGWQHFFHRGILKWLAEVYNGRHPCLQMKSNLIQCMVVASLKVVHNLYVRWSMFYLRQTLVHLQKIEATVSDSVSNFFWFI